MTPAHDPRGAMVTTERSGWRLGFESLEHEIVDGRALEIDGVPPPELRGTLYLVGPARHHVHGDPNGSWFDGDGMVHAVTLSSSGGIYRNRFVETAKKRAEDRAGARVYASFAKPPPGGPLRRVRGALPRSTANANVVSQNGALLALWDGRRPYRIDPGSLETQGEETMGGVLRPWHPFSARPQRHGATGELWNVGLRFGMPPKLRLYRWRGGGSGEVVARERLRVPAAAAAFGLTKTTAVVIVPPMMLPRLPLALLSGRRALADTVRWEPERGTLILLFDLATGRVRYARTSAFMTFAVGQAFDDGSDVVVNLSTFPDLACLRVPIEVMSGEIKSQTYATLERLRIGSDGEVTRTPLVPLDAPVVAPGFEGPTTRIFGLTLNPAGGFVGLPAAVDVATTTVSWATPSPSEYASQPVAVPKAGASCAADTWVLTVVLDSEQARSELRILDGGDLSSPPVARIRLPHVVPLGARGCWVPIADER